jgi:uncharacterized membrane protein YphA (DoxX/SURF4 family)
MSTTISKGLNITLWVLQIVLGGMFIMAGFMKSLQPINELAKSLPWVAESSAALVRFIGVSELLGGVGLILPMALKIKPRLTIWAALGLCAIMILATIFHVSRGEYGVIGMNIIIAAISGFIAWARNRG